ncbi:hypothetical protein [Pedobacter sp. JY14-1]|uniref:hypothetical protein n=1 Tax=Pedobacter sp. JY14-1 TaxID=3034151 RepID=UPI0023E09379|nr:hypothetical protein [Pedobacter sp. JY14-1]
MNNQNKGLEDWNKRLDENLEPEKHGNTAADENAEAFSRSRGSGDQSDDPDKLTGLPDTRDLGEYEDNMAQNHPKASNPEENLSREE